MLSNINECTLSKVFHTKVKSFPGATIADMFDYLKLLLKKRPEKSILVIGANDIEHSTSQEILAKNKALTGFIHGCLPECDVEISESLRRADKKSLNSRIDDFNKLLTIMNCDTLLQQNITFDLLGKRGFHLNAFGNKHLAKNIIEKLRSLLHYGHIDISAIEEIGTSTSFISHFISCHFKNSLRRGTLQQKCWFSKAPPTKIQIPCMFKKNS